MSEEDKKFNYLDYWWNQSTVKTKCGYSVVGIKHIDSFYLVGMIVVPMKDGISTERVDCIWFINGIVSDRAVSGKIKYNPGDLDLEMETITAASK